MKNIEQKLLKHFVGYIDDRDEYQQKMIYKILADANMMTFILLTVCMMISFIWDAWHHTVSLGTIFLFLIQQLNSYYILVKTKKFDVLQTEVFDEDSYKKELRKIKKSAILSGINWGIFMFAWMEFIFPLILNEPIELKWFNVCVWFVASILFAGSMYAVGKGKLKLIKE